MANYFFIFFLPLFILGFSSFTAQLVLARVLIVNLYGNEFFVGWILCAWLVGVGAGSLVAGILGRAWRGLPLMLGCHLLEAWLFPGAIIAIRAGQCLLIGTTGQSPDLVSAAVFSFLAVMPLCCVLGVHFVAAVQYGRECHADKAGARLPGLAYSYEATGFILGGLVFTYVLVSWNEFHVAALFVVLNVLAVSVLLVLKKISAGKWLLIAAGITACLGLGCLMFAEDLNMTSTAMRFPHAQWVETRNSIYGNLAVTRTGRQLDFYESGLSVGTNEDMPAQEKLAHFVMLTHPHPRKVLVIGTGLGRGVREVLQHAPEAVYYAALDPAMIALASTYLPEWRALLKDDRVHLLRGDMRRYFKMIPFDLDVIIMDLPAPSTALINRYFTDEFLREARRHLKPDGVIGLQIAWSQDFTSRPQADLGASIYKTVSKNFTSVLVLPQDTLIILASAGALTRDPLEIIQRFRGRGIKSYFVTEALIVDRYTTDRVRTTEDLFKGNVTARINTDLHPSGYLYYFIGWLNIFHQGLAGAAASLGRTVFLMVLVLALGLLLVPLCQSRTEARRKFMGLGAMALGGFSLMSVEVVVIYGFQIFYGDLYDKIAWIITAFMAGMAAGTLWGYRNPSGSWGRLASLHAGLGVYLACWLMWIRATAHYGWAVSPELWILGGTGIGVLAGIEFTTVNMLKGVRAGTVYAADLAGSSAGALGIGIFMIPVYGIYKTLIFLILINAVMAVILWLSRE